MSDIGRFERELKDLLSRHNAEIHVEFDPESVRDSMVVYLGDGSEGFNLGNFIGYNNPFTGGEH